MMFLLGRQAILGQEPPINLRSTTAVRSPVLASVQAVYLPASPLPRGQDSYSVRFWNHDPPSVSVPSRRLSSQPATEGRLRRRWPSAKLVLTSESRDHNRCGPFLVCMMSFFMPAAVAIFSI